MKRGFDMSNRAFSKSFSLTQARALVKDLSQPSARVYWIDFLTSILTGHGLFLAALHAQKWLHVSGFSYWTVKAILLAAAAVLYMRAVMFIHELVHLRTHAFTSFRIVWNALCGIPFLIPSFLYYPHVDHHRRKSYGTSEDGEYLELSHQHPSHIVGFILAAVVVPPVAFLRFSVLTPIAWCLPAFRKWVERHASSMVIDVFYLRGDFGAKAHRIMRFQEVLCFLWCIFLLTIHPVYVNGSVDPFWLHAYAISMALILINNVRTLGAHRWTSHGEELTFEEQLLDSVNYPHRPWITELWGPVGTRYHALHHLFPSIPYHNLATAHRRLMAGLPADSIYRDTVRVTLLGTILELWWRASASNSGSPKSSTDRHQASAA